MEEAPENGKESPHSAHANGLIDWLIESHRLKMQRDLVVILYDII
jgi:hypothetical protein